MFEAFYKLSANPFRLTPDPKFCFLHSSYNRAYAYLQYALSQGEGIIMVSGRPGVGKTTLTEVILAEIEQSEVVAARIASANVEATDLLRVVAYSFGIDVAGLDKATILLYLEQFFIQQRRSGKRVLLIIDEAHGLPHIALEELRLLADLQMDSSPLLQLFLVGQEKLRDLMREPNMEQFQQRVIGACHLERLDLTETRSYIEHRLLTAGWRGDPELTGTAVLSLYQYSKGVPRHVNKICARLLLHGMLEEKHELHKEDVVNVAEELCVEQLAPMERDEMALADSTEALIMPELESGSLSIADLALRVDPQEASDRPATVAISDVANQVDTTLSVQDHELAAVSSGRDRTDQAPPQKPGWGAVSSDIPDLPHQHSRQELSGFGEFPGELRRRPKSARAAVSPIGAVPQVMPAWWHELPSCRFMSPIGAAQQVLPRTAQRDNAVKWVKALLAKSGTWWSVMSTMSITLSQYAGETARMFGKFKWKDKPALLFAALLVVSLITAVLMTHVMEDSGVHKPLLLGYPEPIQENVNQDQSQALAAPTGEQKNSGMVDRKNDKQVAEREDSTASTRTAASTSTGQQPDGGQDDSFENIVDTWDREGVIASPRGRVLEQSMSESRVTETSVQKTVLAAPEPDMATIESVVASGSMQSDSQAKVGEQIGDGVNSRMMASVAPSSQSGSVLSQDKSSSSKEAQIDKPVNSAGSVTLGTTPEALAKAPTSSVGGEEGSSVLVEQKAVPPAVIRQEKVAELLSLGHQSLKRDRLLIPKHDSAYKYYQQTLVLEPGNNEALFGIERIVARYMALARKALERQDKKKSRHFVDLGLSITPTDKHLLALRASLNTTVAVVEPEIQPPVAQAEEQTLAAELKPEPENFISRLKVFFTKGQSSDKLNETVVEKRR